MEEYLFGDSTQTEEQRKSLEEILRNMPLNGYPIEELVDIINSPWSTSRWHFETRELPKYNPLKVLG